MSYESEQQNRKNLAIYESMRIVKLDKTNQTPFSLAMAIDSETHAKLKDLAKLRAGPLMVKLYI